MNNNFGENIHTVHIKASLLKEHDKNKNTRQNQNIY